MVRRDSDKRAPAKFRIGGPDETVYLLYRRGDTCQEISARFGLSVDEVSAAIERARAGERQELNE